MGFKERKGSGSRWAERADVRREQEKEGKGIKTDGLLEVLKMEAWRWEGTGYSRSCCLRVSCLRPFWCLKRTGI